MMTASLFMHRLLLLLLSAAYGPYRLSIIFFLLQLRFMTINCINHDPVIFNAHRLDGIKAGPVTGPTGYSYPRGHMPGYNADSLSFQNLLSF